MCFTKLFYYWCQVFQKTLANYHIIISSLLANVSVFKLSFSWRRWWLGWHHIMTERRERLTDTDTSGLIMLSPRISADWVLQSYTLTGDVQTAVQSQHCTVLYTPQNITIYCIFFYHANISSTVPSRYMQCILVRSKSNCMSKFSSSVWNLEFFPSNFVLCWW